MNLQEQINKDFIDAMKAKETQKLSVLRMLKSALKNKEIALRQVQGENKKLSDEQVGEAVTKEVKQRKDSISEFEKGGRIDLAKKEKDEIKFLEKYLPKQLSGKEVTKIINEAISKTGASSPSDMGKVMGAIMPKLKGKADGSQVSKLVKEKLEK